MTTLQLGFSLINARDQHLGLGCKESLIQNWGVLVPKGVGTTCSSAVLPLSIR